jgi:hypothetical protein
MNSAKFDAFDGSTVSIFIPKIKEEEVAQKRN